MNKKTNTRFSVKMLLKGIAFKMLRLVFEVRDKDKATSVAR